MLQRSLAWALALSACALSCGGSSANSPPAGSEPVASGAEAPAAEEETGTAPVADADPATSEAVSAATQAAEGWLQLVDQQEYDRSHSTAAGVFRGAITPDAWSQAVGGVRGSLGKLVSRKLSTANYTTTLPGVPDGKYVVMQYETSFENKASAVETVTSTQDSDGVWRVAGYFVK